MEPDDTRRVGSRFGFSGSLLGLPLCVEEIVTGRQPPARKTWETTAQPSLWVIGRYRMGFDIRPAGDLSILRVHINYALPEGGLPRLLGRLFGPLYARWCTTRMVKDAEAHFGASQEKQLRHA